MKYFKRNGFVALVSMLSLTAYAGDSLPLSVAVSETKEFIQVSGHGIDTSNVIQQERIIQSVSLISGIVEVSPKGGKSVTRIKPGECFVYDDDNAISKIKKADLESVNAWKESLIVMKEKPITDLLMQVEQLYNVNLSYSLTELQDISISGKLDTSVPVGTFLHNLSQIAPIKVDKKGNDYIITYD